MEFFHTIDLPYLINGALRLIILIFFIALLGLFVSLGVQKRKLAIRAKEDAERTQLFARKLAAVEAGELWRIDSLQSMRDLVCLGRACSAHFAKGETRADGVAFSLDTPYYAPQIVLLKRGMEAKNWGARYQAIDTIANLRLHTLFYFLLQHSLVEKNSSVTTHCLYVCALLLRDAEEFNALSNRLNQDDQLSTNLVEGLTRIAIQQLQKHQNARTVAACLTASLNSASHGQLFKIGLINAIGKEEIIALKDVLIALVSGHGGDTDKVANTDPALTLDDNAITLAVMRAIVSFKQYDAVIREQLTSDQPTMQIVALRSSLYCDDASLTEVAEQLHSLHFDVRYAAATTLAKMGERGQFLLKKAQLGTDRYASNIATFALAIG